MILIGEKLNGSVPAVAQAIAVRDAAFIRARARAQADAGAAFIDLCASVEEPVEPQTLRWMIEQVQQACDVPVCLDSPSVHSCVAAIPFCARPGLLNSVSLAGDGLARALAAVADSEWGLVALLSDGRGIPADTGRSMEIFALLLARAAASGVRPDRLYVDPLVRARATAPDAYTAFAACVRRIRAARPDVHITSGLSNISFGLPARRLINRAFLFLAVLDGMDSAIADPTDPGTAAVVRAAETLRGREQTDGDRLAAVERGCALARLSARDAFGVRAAAKLLLFPDEDPYCLEYIRLYRAGRFGPDRA